MTKIVFLVEDEYCSDNLEVIQPAFKLKFESEGDTLTEHLQAFKMVMRAIGHAEDNVSRIKCEGFHERLDRYRKAEEIAKIKNELYEKHLEKEAKKAAKKKEKKS